MANSWQILPPWIAEKSWDRKGTYLKYVPISRIYYDTCNMWQWAVIHQF